MNAPPFCQCGKVRYFTRRDARTAIRRMKGREGRLNAYRCPEEPEVWHIGHLPTGVRQGLYGRETIRRRSA